MYQFHQIELWGHHQKKGFLFENNYLIFTFRHSLDHLLEFEHFTIIVGVEKIILNFSCFQLQLEFVSSHERKILKAKGPTSDRGYSGC